MSNNKVFAIFCLVFLLVFGAVPIEGYAVDYYLGDGKSTLSLQKQAKDVTDDLPVVTDEHGNSFQFFDVTLSISGGISQTSVKSGGDVLIVLDQSGSMKSNKVDGVSLANELKQNLNGTLAEEGLLEHLVGLGCNVGVVAFGDTSKAYNFNANNQTTYDHDVEVLPYELYFTNNLSKLENAVSDALDIDSGTSTNTHGGLLMAKTLANGWELSKNADKSENLIVVVFTDGVPTARYLNSSSVTNDSSSAYCSKEEFNDTVETGQDILKISDDIDIFTFGMLASYNEGSDQFNLAQRLLGETSYKYNRLNNESNVAKDADNDSRWTETSSYVDMYIPLNSSATESDYKEAFEKLSETIEEVIELKVDLFDEIPQGFELVENSIVIQNSANSENLQSPSINAQNELTIDGLAVSTDKQNPTTVKYTVKYIGDNYGNTFSNVTAYVTTEQDPDTKRLFPKPVVGLKPKTVDDVAFAGVGQQIEIDITDNDFLKAANKVFEQGYKIDDDITISLYNLDGTPIDPVDYSVTIKDDKLSFVSNTGNTKEFLYTININAEIHEDGEQNTKKEISLTSRKTKVTVNMTTSHTVNKTWVDLSADNKATPPKIEVFLERSSDGVTFEPVEGKKAILTPEGSNGSYSATYTFTELQAGEQDKQYIYRAYENTESKAYAVTTTCFANQTNITNTRKLYDEDGDITVLKVWDDEQNKFSNRPDTLEISLTGTAGNAVLIGQNKTLLVNSSADSQEVLFENMPSHSVLGVEITYLADETTVPSGYAKSIDGLCVTNSTIKSSITVKKIFDGGTEELSKISSVKVDILSSVSSTIMDSLELLPSEGYTAQTVLLPTYLNGQKAVYRAVETDIVPIDQNDPILGVFTSTSSISSSNEITLTNVYESSTRDFLVTKNWEVYEYDQYKTPVEITLAAAVLDAPITIDGITTTATLSEQNGYSYTFSQLPITDSEGNTITYSVSEDVNDDVFESVVEYNESGATITNSLRVNSVELTKVWVDQSNRDLMREDITLLFQRMEDTSFQTFVEIDYAEAEFISDSLSKDVINLPIYDIDGTLIEYNLVEQSVPTGYEVSYKLKEDETEQTPSSSGFNLDKQTYEVVVTNTYVVDDMTVEFLKVWDDDNNRDGIRPTVTSPEDDPLGVTLEGGMFHDGKAPDSVEVTDQGWLYTFNNIPVNYNRQTAEYLVFEQVPQGYTCNNQPENSRIAAEPEEFSEIDNSMSFTLTNTHIPERATVTLVKTWEDDQDMFSNRPDDVSVELQSQTAGAQIPTPFIVKQDNVWTYTWPDMFAFQNGARVTYDTPAVGEIPNFYDKGTVFASDQTGLNFEVAHTYAVEPLTYTVQKVWQNDRANDIFARPSGVAVRLEMQLDGESGFSDTFIVYPTDVILVGNEDTWTFAFSELPAYVEGRAAQYRVREVTNLSPTYTTSYSYGENVTTIYNSYNVTTEVVPVSTVPQTDDRFPLDVMWILSAVSVVLVGISLAIKFGFKNYLKQNPKPKESFDIETYRGTDEI